MASKQQIEALLDKGLTASQIAERLGCESGYVRATLYRNHWHDRVARSNKGRQLSAATRLRHAAPDLLEALRGVEWGCEVDAAEGGFVAGCPSCGAEKRTGEHHQDCQLNAALTKTEGR